MKLPQQNQVLKGQLMPLPEVQKKVTPSPYSRSVFFVFQVYHLFSGGCFLFVSFFCSLEILKLVFPHRWGHLSTSRDSSDDVGNDILTKSPFLRQVAYMSPYTFDPCVGFFSKQLCVVSIHICLILVDKDML